MADLLLTFYRESLRAVLHCSRAGCELEVACPAEHPDCCPAFWLEILFQPTDPHGWPQGLPRSLFEAELAMSQLSNAPYRRGWLRLPFRLQPDLLQRCHLRLTCRRLESAPTDPHL